MENDDTLHKPIEYDAAMIGSMNHHSSVVQIFSSHVLNTTALFNVGAFTALLAFVPSSIGQALMSRGFLEKTLIISGIGCFVIGFAFCIATMVAVFRYSLSRFKFYRTELRKLTSGKPHIILPKGAEIGDAIKEGVDNELNKIGEQKISKIAQRLLAVCGVFTLVGVILVFFIVLLI